ncbi:MAG: hypothetical protein WC455_20850 [Dehalococcoidia bacterium]|jgi:hypothetical protein
MSISKRPLIVIEWEDMTTDTQGWKMENSLIKDEPLLCTAVGWQIPSDRQYVFLATMRSSSGRCTDVHQIPRKAIKSLRRVE